MAGILILILPCKRFHFYFAENLYVSLGQNHTQKKALDKLVEINISSVGEKSFEFRSKKTRCGRKKFFTQ